MEKGRFKPRAMLDATASMAMIAVAGVMLWSMFGAASRRTPEGQPPLRLPTMPLALDGAAVSGSPNAKVAMVEFSDFECPFSRQFVQNTRPLLEARYVKTGVLQIAFRHLPLTKIHPNAQRAAEAAVCAGEQGRFWDLSGLLFSKPDTLAEAELSVTVKEMGINQDAYRQCLKSAPSLVQLDVQLAKDLGVSRTPAFFIGVLEARRVRVLKAISGARPLGEFTAAIDATLAIDRATER